MTRPIYQKKRRFRIDPSNPYRTRFLIYSIIGTGHNKFKIRVEQQDYVLRSQVAEDAIVTEEIEGPDTARQLVGYMLEKVRSLSEVANVISLWRKGQLPLVNEKENILVRKALDRRFARNLKKL